MDRYLERVNYAFETELKALFPDEFKLFDAIEKERLEADSKIRAAHDNKYRMYDREIRYTSWGRKVWREYRDQADAVEAEAAQKKRALIASNPRVGLVALLQKSFRRDLSIPTQQQTYDVLKKIADLEKNERAKAELLQRASFIDDVYPIEPKPSATAYPKWQAVKEALGSKTGAMINFGIPITAFSLFGLSDYAQSRMALNGCTEAYGLSERESVYLKDGPYLGVKAKPEAGCRSVRFVTQPVDEYKNLVRTFGGVPEGICKIVKNQSEYFDQIADPSAPSASCTSSTVGNRNFNLDLEKSEIQISESGTDYVFP